MAGPIKVTPSLFRAVKAMTKDGATYEEIEDFFKISHATVTRIKYAENYEEYRNECVARSKAIHAKRQAKRQEKKAAEMAAAQPEPEKKPEKVEYVAPQVTPGGFLASSYQTNRIIEELAKQNEILKIISNKLAFIVDELTGTGVKEA